MRKGHFDIMLDISRWIESLLVTGGIVVTQHGYIKCVTSCKCVIMEGILSIYSVACFSLTIMTTFSYSMTSF